MLLLQESNNNFWYDHGVSLVSATVTFLAFLLTFVTLIFNSLKEKKEAEDKSEKTLSVLDFIFENNDDELKSHLRQMKYIRMNTHEGIHFIHRTIHKASTIEEWKKTRNRELDLHFNIELKHLNIAVPGTGLVAKTRFENNYIVLETSRYLKENDLQLSLNKYEDELKTNLKNQHLNITSGSLEKISDKIHAIKECRGIFESIRIQDLVDIAVNERSKTEEEISEVLEKHPLHFINEDYEKILKLEEKLEEVVKPLSDDNSL